MVADVDAHDDGPRLRARLSTGRNLLGRLIVRLKPAGTYAFHLFWNGAEGNICCGFSVEGDADRLAESVQAKSVSRWPGWSSQRVFTLDDALRSAIVDVLAASHGIDGRRSVKSTTVASANRRAEEASRASDDAARTVSVHGSLTNLVQR